jgi:ABC-type polysaccharide/polyol phosphate transport system ATPase subunit
VNDPSPSTSDDPDRPEDPAPDEAPDPIDAPEADAGVDDPEAQLPPAIELENVSATYRVRMAGSRWAGVLDLLRRARSSDRLVHALKDVSLTVPRGQVLGVIGRNGAGKSTLLRTMAGILAPDTGRVVVRGRMATLLTIGIGFNDQLTGRENVKLGGLGAGLTEERLEELTETIIAFAQLGEYIDFPVRTYSSGMRSRLGFAIASHLDPEILLIDEALAGGDSKFREQVAKKMWAMCGDGRTIVLVSHGLTAIRLLCTEAVWLHEGHLVELGPPDRVVDSYMRFCRLEASSLPFDDE